jgi:ribosome-associated toxin RatA of RatAB toxin-antitoxin module
MVLSLTALAFIQVRVGAFVFKRTEFNASAADFFGSALLKSYNPRSLIPRSDMYQVKRSAIVPYSAEEMYELVRNVDAYRDFLPWCGGAATLESDGNRTRARIDIDFKGLKKSFVTENFNQPGERIEIRLSEGPFRVLRGDWTFKEIGEAASQVNLDLEFEFSGSMLDKLLGPVFKGISGSMVDSFVKRAEQVYGRRKLDIG